MLLAHKTTTNKQSLTRTPLPHHHLLLTFIFIVKRIVHISQGWKTGVLVLANDAFWWIKYLLSPVKKHTKKHTRTWCMDNKHLNIKHKAYKQYLSALHRHQSMMYRYINPRTKGDKSYLSISQDLHTYKYLSNRRTSDICGGGNETYQWYSKLIKA